MVAKRPAKNPTAKRTAPSKNARNASKVSPLTRPASKKPAAATNPAPKNEYITKDMTMGDILSRYPDAAYIMLSHGLHCIGCHISPYESLEMGSMGHGMSEAEFKTLLSELNALAMQKETPSKAPSSQS